MKAILDHVGIAVNDLQAALTFYRDTLGLEIDAPEEVVSQRVRAHFVPVGESSLELLEATAPDSPIARYLEKRGPGLHHITLRVEDIGAALAQLKARGARLIDDQPRPGAEGALVAFVHPSSAQGVLVELKQSSVDSRQSSVDPESPVVGTEFRESRVQRFALGDLELISVSDGFFRLDGGSMFGAVPKTLWSAKAPADERNRIALAMRPLIVRGARTMIIDAGLGDKEHEAFQDRYGVDRARNLDHALAEAGIAPEQIDIVAGDPSAFRPRRRLHRARRVRPPPSAVSPRAVRRPPRRVGRCDASARTESRVLSVGQLRAAGGRGRPSARRRRSDDHAGREGQAHRWSHQASPDGRDRVARQERVVRRRPDADDGARA